MLLCLLFLVQTATPAKEVQAATKQTIATTKNGTLIKYKGKYYYMVKGKRQRNVWKIIDSNKYYFDANGVAATYSYKVKGQLYLFDLQGRLVRRTTPTVVKVGKQYYCVNKYGKVSTGWMIVKNKLYYADSKGRCYKNRTRDGVAFGSNGVAKNSIDRSLKMKTMQIVSSITNTKMTKAQKLRACWNYVVSGAGYSYSSAYYPNLNASGWQKETAYRMLTTKQGNCYGFACAFAALAREVGYNPNVICGRVSGTRDGAADGLTRHCWVTINGCHYDPEGQWKGWFTGVYGSGSYDISHTIQKVVNFAEG